MTKLKPKVIIKDSIHVLQDKAAAKKRLSHLSILLDISIEAYTGEITYIELKKKEVEI